MTRMSRIMSQEERLRWVRYDEALEGAVVG